MPPELYDPIADTEHPVLVLRHDDAMSRAVSVTRTTKWHAKTRRFVEHPPDPRLRLNQRGWWRLGNPLTVAYENFFEADVRFVGTLDLGCWDEIAAVLAGGRR